MLVRSISHTRYEEGDFDLDEPYRRIEAMAREQSIAICNPLDVFRQQRLRGVSLYLPHDMHFSPAGHRLFAEQIARALASLPARTPN